MNDVHMLAFKLWSITWWCVTLYFTTFFFNSEFAGICLHCRWRILQKPLPIGNAVINAQNLTSHDLSVSHFNRRVNLTALLEAYRHSI